MTTLLSDLIALTKPKIIVLLLITAVGGLFLASEGLPDLWITLAVLAGGALGAGGANTINQYLERDIDDKMSRTDGRPLVSGSIGPLTALIFGIVLNLVAFAILWQFANFISAILTLVATLFYVFVYTMLLKRTTSQNIVIGGAAGSIPPMVGWAAVTGNILDPAPIMLFVNIFVWTPPHFWALSLILKEDYARAGVPMLPVVKGVKNTKKQIFVYTWILMAVVVITTLTVDSLGIIYGLTNVIFVIIFSWMSWKLMRETNIRLALPIYLFSLLYLALSFGSIMIDGMIEWMDFGLTNVLP